MPITVAMRTEISQLYVSLFGRAPDGEGLGFWVSSYDKGTSLASIAQSMYDTAPARAYYPLFATPSEIVTTFYTNVLGRAPDAEGLAFWVKEYSAATTQGAFFSKLISNVVNYNGTDAAGLTSKSLFTNKVAVAQYYGEQNGTVAGATAALSGVTAVAASVDTAKAAIVNAAAAGQAFTLTTNVDTFTGTTANDTFSADILTLNAGDALIGGLGTDILNFTGTTNVALPAASITGIETINVRQIGAALASTDLSLTTGVTAVNFDRSNVAGTFTNMPAGGVYGVIGNAGVSNTGALALGYLTGSTVTAATINFSGGTLGAQPVTLTGANLLSTTINSTGVANVTGAFVDAATSKALTINATSGLTTGTIGDSAARTALTINATGDVTTGAVTSSVATTASITGTGKVTTDLNLVVAPTITVAGSGAVSIGTLNAASLTLTSTQTGGSLTATMNGIATTKVTGGAGNDVITTGVALTTGFANGGDGTDTLVLGAVGHANTTTLAAKYTNFETLRLAGTFDTSLIGGITAIETTGTVVLSGMSAAQAANVTVRADTAATSTFALTTATGTSDVLNLKMGVGTTTLAATNAVGAVVVTGFETLNITATPGPTVATAAAMLSSFDTAFTGATLSSINLLGSAVSIADAATTVAATWNASALTGDANATNAVTAAATKGLTLAGSLASGSTVTGSNFIDTITIGATGAAGSTYNLGLGADAISTTFANLRTGSVYNNIDGGGGTDTVTLTGGASLTMVDADFKGLTNIEKITIATTTTNPQSITTGGFFDTNFKTVGSTLTTTSSTGAIVVDQSSFTGTNAVTATSTTGVITISGGSGNNTITATSVGTGAGEGTQTITTLGGNDTVTSTSAVANTTTNVINTGAGIDTIVAGLGKDSITGGTGVDTMTGGGAVDTFAFGTNGSLVSAGLDIITDFNTAGADVLTFGGNTTVLAADTSTLVAGTNVQTSTGGVVTFATADNTYALKLAAVQADTQLDVAGSVAIFVDSGNTYVYYAGAAAGNTDDQVIQLTGVTGLATITGGATTTIA